MKDQVIEEIKQLCGKVMMLNNGWCHFVYRHLHFVTIPDDSNDMIRFSIPHVVNSANYTREVLDKAINETNREVKFINAYVGRNSVSSIGQNQSLTSLLN